MPTHWTSYLVMLLALALVIRRNMRGRRLRLETLWVLPAVLAAATVFILAAEPPPSLTVGAGLGLALAIGAAVGWQRGRFTRIALDPATHSFTSQASPIGMIFLAGLFAARFALRAYLAQSPHNAALTLAATDALLLFAVGTVGVQRLEMALRCRKMLQEARNAPPRSGAVSEAD